MSRHFRANIRFTAVLTHLRGNLANDERCAVAFERDGRKAVVRFTDFADHAFHSFLFSKPGSHLSGSGS